MSEEISIANVFFGGIGGAAITAGVTLWIHQRSKKLPSGKAYEIIKKLERRLNEPEGEYHFTKSSDENYEVASEIYKEANGDVIATAFHENPVDYGVKGDIARSIQCSFSRITAEEVCDNNSTVEAIANLNKIKPGASLIVVPKGEKFTRIDGMFCRLKDGSHLAFITFRNASNPSLNRGVVFRDGIAEGFYDYYFELKQRYENP